MKNIFIIFQEHSVAKNYLKTETNFNYFIGHSGTGLKSLITIDLLIFKTFFVHSF